MGSELRITGAGARLSCTGASAGKREFPAETPANLVDELFNARNKARFPKQDTHMTNAFWTTPGFGPMTRISTNFGEVPAQALRERDLVRTYGGNFLPVVWVDRIVLSEEFLMRHPDAMPVELHAGLFSHGLPKQPVVLSPGQVISPDPNSGPTVRQKVRDLLDRQGVERKSEDIFTYTRLHLGEPAYVCAEGLWVHLCPEVQQGRAA